MFLNTNHENFTQKNIRLLTDVLDLFANYQKLGALIVRKVLVITLAFFGYFTE